MNVLTEIKDDFAKYFRQRGVPVTWDFSKSTGRYWYELHDEQGLVCQVDFGTPLEEFLTDLPYFIENKSGIGPTDYECCCPDSERLRKLYERVKPDGDAKPQPKTEEPTMGILDDKKAWNLAELAIRGALESSSETTRVQGAIALCLLGINSRLEEIDSDLSSIEIDLSDIAKNTEPQSPEHERK